MTKFQMIRRMRMKINVLFFASVREMVGINAKEVDIQDSENSPHKLLNFLIKSEQGLWISLHKDKHLIRLAINQELADWNDLLSDGDELAFFPPITGG